MMPVDEVLIVVLLAMTVLALLACLFTIGLLVLARANQHWQHEWWTRQLCDDCRIKRLARRMLGGTATDDNKTELAALVMPDPTTCLG